MRNVNINSKIEGSVWGLIVGDALGVPVEFMSRAELSENPVFDMIGYGTHNQPPGTWSDDSSMTLATMEWVNEQTNLESPNYRVLMEKFCSWLMHGDYTPYGENFDCGITVSRALGNFRKGVLPVHSGEQSEHSNGNGALMRILPAIIAKEKELAVFEDSAVKFLYDMTALTHGHARSKIGCLIYAAIITNIFEAQPMRDKEEILRCAIKNTYDYLTKKESNEVCKEEIKSYHRLFNLGSFVKIGEREIKSSGYVVDTLEAAVWCFLTTKSFKECVLKAVNLGEDTDTVGAVAGGLAGAYYGKDDIPSEWVKILPKKEWIEDITEEVIAKVKL